MPLFDFECSNEKCDERIEIFFRSKEHEAPSCQKCGSEMKKQLSLFGAYAIKGNNSASVTPKKFRGGRKA